MTLERMIKSMTIATPNGGRYNIGKASITVSYCSDFWEWEYLGETYWDVQDLAEAIVQGTAGSPQRRSLCSKSSKVQGKMVRSNHPVTLSFLDVRRLILGAILVRRAPGTGSIPARAFCSDGLTASKRHTAWPAGTNSNSIVLPCAAEGFVSKARGHQLDGVTTSS